MKTALIMMTILGCDDAMEQCKYVETAPERFVSVALCDAATDNVLARYTDIPYPTAVAVCQAPAPEIVDQLAQGKPDFSNDTTNALAPEVQEPNEEEKQSLAKRAVQAIRGVIPDKDDIKMVVQTPFHVVSDSYSWVARKINP
ncbi:hypothetical protein FE840_013000 [Peteryoungia desertarenae]|uniref:Uncharacterized protein n=1 Tax=Peteryoungia desertarenae TaxID=1813451 RepID=A0ABX6QPL3_9HYPH|nr:hypothetical protein [Peteryoungia desertarenae]QLF70377.1 hypothetical protein FE840_013000 [Peteryoungia desertarenae]